jgi:hypothetical protein
MDARTAEVRRLLDRYLVEVVEAYGLCPWAKPARLAGEIAVDVVFGAPDAAAFAAAATALLARPETRVAMVVAPELVADAGALSAIRDRVAALIPTAGVADFHPHVQLDLASPARLVPFLRRSPDPMLQLVPLAILDNVREAPPIADRAMQAQILGGAAPAPRAGAADRIAADNHATVTAQAEAMALRLADIAADRTRSYARVGITSGGCR